MKRDYALAEALHQVRYLVEGRARRLRTLVDRTSVDDYIGRLPWGDSATPRERVLVAGNLRAFAALMREALDADEDAADWTAKRRQLELECGGDLVGKDRRQVAFQALGKACREIQLLEERLTSC